MLFRSRLNPLATAKGQKLLCELTGKPASIVVSYFGVPYYYCDRSTLELDWNGIKQKIAQLLVPLRQPPSVIPSVEERERQEANVRKSKLALIDLCRMEATKFLVHGDFELSIPGAVQALRYSLDVYGAGKIELVPCYLLLAEANLGLGRHKQAEEYLSLANWSILKNPDCSNRTKSQLYRNFGKLYAFWTSETYLRHSRIAQNGLDKAIEALSLKVAVDTKADIEKMSKKVNMLPMMDQKLNVINQKVDQVLANQAVEQQKMDAVLDLAEIGRAHV